MKCKICAKKHHYCNNCGYDEDLAPFANGYCCWEHFIEGYDSLKRQVKGLTEIIEEIVDTLEKDGRFPNSVPEIKIGLAEVLENEE